VTRRALIESTIQESLATKQRLLDDSNTLDALEQLATRIQQQLATGRKVLLAGNGGSAADAQHIAAEFVGRFEIERDALAAIALTTDTSALTAIGNDYGFEHVFARQVSGLGQAGDIFIGISTSGNSANIVRAMEVARSKGLHTVALVGAKAGQMHALADTVLAAPSTRTARIQECHILMMHLLCQLVDES
jgi:D-sedoheptulose 7-phosphate isomerase